VRPDAEDVGQRQRRAVVGLVEDLLGLVTVERVAALAPVVVQDPVVGLAVDLPDQVLGLREAVADQTGQLVALLLAEPIHAVLPLRGWVLVGGAAVAGGLGAVGHGSV